MTTQEKIWERKDPIQHDVYITAEPAFGGGLLHQGSGIGKVRCCQCVGNGFSPLLLSFIPARCPAVQERHQFWLAGLQPRQQRLAKEIMIAIPLPLVIERHHKEVSSFEIFEHLLARSLCRPLHHCLA